MKVIKPFAFLLLMLIFSCKAQQSQLKEINKQPSFFMSGWNGGNAEPGFEILKTDRELSHRINIGGSNGNVVLAQAEEESHQEKKYRIPRKQVVVYYSFGMRRAGQFKAQGIDSLRWEGATLLVFLKDKALKPKNPGGFQPQIQVISYPWMAFSVPETWKFDEIQIK